VLYEATRCVWNTGIRRRHARYACAVPESVVREVFESKKWVPAGATPHATRPHEGVTVPGRWEFISRQAPTEVRER